MTTASSETPELRPLRIGEILDVGIKIYTRNSKTLFTLVALVVIPVQILGVLIIISTIPDALATASQNPFELTPQTQPAEVPEVREFLVYVAAVFVVLILIFISTAIATAACFRAVTAAYLGGQPDWRSSFRFARERVGRILWVTFLAGLGTSVGLVFCILPGIWLGVVWSVATPVLLTEERRGTKALARSFELVQTRFWPTLGVLAISYLIETVLNSAVGGSLLLLTITNIGDNLLLSQILSGTGQTIAAILATPFRAAVIAVLYFDLRVRKEGFDLQLLARRIGTPEPETAHAALLPPPLPAAPSYPTATYPPGTPPVVYSTPPLSGLAIASVVSSTILCVGSIPGVVMGHLALARINASQGTLGGRGAAIAGIIVGWIGTVLLALIVLGVLASS